MKPKYAVRLIPRENDKPGVVAHFMLEQELCIGPELIDHLRRALSVEGKHHQNPFSIDNVPISLDEISRILLTAIELADTGISIPAGASIEVASGQTAGNMSLLDFCHLDGQLRNCVSFRVQGSAPPYELIFTSGLTRWSLKAASQSEAKTVTANLEALAAAAIDPNSDSYISDPISRASITATMLDSVKCWVEIWAAHGLYEARMESDYQNFRRHEQELRERMQKGCERGFRDTESGGFRGDGGFFK